MKLLNVVLASLFTATLAACSKPTDATKENFAKVLGKWASQKCGTSVMVSGLDSPHIMTYGMGYEVDVTNNGYPVTVVWVKPPEMLRQLDALVSVGLLTGKDLPENAVAHSDTLLHGHHQQRQYALTDEGRKVLFNNTGFCAGSGEIEVVNFTAPSPSAGFGETVARVMTMVTVSASVKEVATWAHSATVAAAFPDLASTLQEKKQADIPLVLMNDGWAVVPPR